MNDADNAAAVAAPMSIVRVCLKCRCVRTFVKRPWSFRINREAWPILRYTCEKCGERLTVEMPKQ